MAKTFPGLWWEISQAGESRQEGVQTTGRGTRSGAWATTCRGCSWRGPARNLAQLQRANGWRVMGGWSPWMAPRLEETPWRFPYVCMYVCMHACMYVCMYHTYMRMYVFMYVCMYVCMYDVIYIGIYWFYMFFIKIFLSKFKKESKSRRIWFYQNQDVIGFMIIFTMRFIVIMLTLN